MMLNLRRIDRLSLGQAKALVCLSAVLIAAVDFLLPANINIAIFYFLPIVLAGWTHSVKWLWSFTAFFILLTFGGIALAPAPIANAVTWVNWLNRGMIAVALVVVAALMHLRTEAEANLHQSESSLRELSMELLHAQDEERRNIGRELHDGLGQCLAGLKLNLHFLDSAIPAAEVSARKHFAECLESSDDAISQVRTLSHLLYPPMLEHMGLESAIPWYVQGFEQRSGIQTSVEMPEGLERLPQELELAIFRILQESLTNLHRHSGSRTAEVRFEVKQGAIVLQVKDSGKGIRNQVIGVGLRSMRERAKQLNGTLEISSGTQGTTVTATLPYQKKSARK